MAEERDPPQSARPSLGEKARADLAARREREAAALRANLRRRKDQARAREAEPVDAPETPASGQHEVPR
jgi:hypothetical protein